MTENRRQDPLPRALLRQDGMVLLSTLLILASVSLMAIGMSSDTASDVKIAGNRKLIEQTFHLADGAADVGVQILLDYFNDAVDPESDYPGPGAVFPLAGGAFYLKDLRLHETLHADIKGYPENDNEEDSVNHNPDIAFTLEGPSGSSLFTTLDVAIDIDRLGASYLPGSSIEFAGGYEGVGKGASAGSVAVYYAVHTQASPPPRQTPAGGGPPPLASQITTVYRKVSHIVDGE